MLLEQDVEALKRQVEALGFLVFCLDSKEEIEVMLDAIVQAA